MGKVVGVFVIASALAAPATALASAWSTPEAVTSSGFAPRVTVNAAGDGVVAFIEDNGAEPGGTSASLVPAGGPVGVAQQVLPPSRPPSLAIADDGDVYVATLAEDRKSVV